MTDYSYYVAEAPSNYGKNDSFPCGIYFGTLIKERDTNRTGCVVGFDKDAVKIAFEGLDKTEIVVAKSKDFEKGLYSVN